MLTAEWTRAVLFLSFPFFAEIIAKTKEQIKTRENMWHLKAIEFFPIILGDNYIICMLLIDFGKQRNTGFQKSGNIIQA